MKNVRFGYLSNSPIYINEDLINKVHFIIEHRKRDEYLVYTEELGSENLYVKFHTKHNAEYFLYELNVKEFFYKSSNGSSYYKDIHLFPDEEYEWKRFKYLKRKDK